MRDIPEDSRTAVSSAADRVVHCTVGEDGYFDSIAAVYDDYKNDPTRTEFAAEDIEAELSSWPSSLETDMRSSSVSELPDRAPSGAARRAHARHRISRPMVDRLIAKPGGEDISVHR